MRRRVWNQVWSVVDNESAGSTRSQTRRSPCAVLVMSTRGRADRAHQPAGRTVAVTNAGSTTRCCPAMAWPPLRGGQLVAGHPGLRHTANAAQIDRPVSFARKRRNVRQTSGDGSPAARLLFFLACAAMGVRF